jgi:hypothetical protein
MRQLKESNEAVQRIYSEFRWQLKIKQHTYDSAAALLDAAIAMTKTEVPDKNIRDLAVEGFEKMRARLSEFTS